ncbi:hypothetical protein EVAR_16062_1 [Eumeta japonica]|uniref:Uncharacterized protein n=1 Tax=Eumeta variegata TaxID=151549 RepID=A0A4C1UJQ4_EUMVA|nr:hypothetical protein EVAR_16062_1 [Eumeta japonica]
MRVRSCNPRPRGNKLRTASAISLANIYNWFDQFGRDRTNLTDDLREGLSSPAKTDDNIIDMRFVIEIDKRMTYHRFGQVKASL